MTAEWICSRLLQQHSCHKCCCNNLEHTAERYVPDCYDNVHSMYVVDTIWNIPFSSMFQIVTTTFMARMLSIQSGTYRSAVCSRLLRQHSWHEWYQKISFQQSFLYQVVIIWLCSQTLNVVYKYLSQMLYFCILHLS